MSGRVHIGTSGWDYDHWRGRFYSEDLPRGERLGVYARAFETVEVNNTFYQQPSDATFDSWRKRAPDGFVYAVKAHRYITHVRKLGDAAIPLRKFLDGVDRLGDHLGPVLFQLPPNWGPNLPRLEAFLERLPGDHQHVFEFRHRGWLSDDVYRLLREHGVGLVVHDKIRRHPRRITGRIAYVRFHGAGAQHDVPYRRRRLERWARWIRDVSGHFEVFVYFNDDTLGRAVREAKRLREILGA